MTNGTAKLPGPFSLLIEAIRKVPATRYALAIGGIVSVVAIVISSFKISLWVAVLGPVVMLVLMVVFVVFANLADQKKNTFIVPVLVFTWFSLVLVMATALVVFSSAFWKWPLDLGSAPVDPRSGSLLVQLGDLRRDAQSRSRLNTWTAYNSDYGALGKITIQYLHYIEENPIADRDNKIIEELRTTLAKIRKLNDKTQTQQFPTGDPNEYHAQRLPDIFDNLLRGIRENKKNGLSSEWEPCYEAAIQRWFKDANPEYPDAPSLSLDCSKHLNLEDPLP